MPLLIQYLNEFLKKLIPPRGPDEISGAFPADTWSPLSLSLSIYIYRPRWATPNMKCNCAHKLWDTNACMRIRIRTKLRCNGFWMYWTLHASVCLIFCDIWVSEHWSLSRKCMTWRQFYCVKAYLSICLIYTYIYIVMEWFWLSGRVTGSVYAPTPFSPPMPLYFVSPPPLALGLALNHSP